MEELRELHVLVIDDDEDDFLIVEDLLKKASGLDFHLEWAPSFREGIAALESKAFDVCLLDFRLGEHSGIELLRTALVRECRTPMILLTGMDDHRVDIEAMRAGAVDYLAKGELSAALLERSVRYAAMRGRAEQELRLSHQRLQETTEQLIESEKLIALGELTAGIAHELNQPLNGIKIISQAIIRWGERYERKQVDADLREILALVASMARILDQMRLVATNRKYKATEPIEVCALVADALRSVEDELKAAQIELRVDLCDPSPRVLGDPPRLEQTLHYLVANARDALELSPKGARQIAVSVSILAPQDEPGAPLAVIDVADSGPGVSKEVRSKVFQPFFTTKEPGSGIGLGLAVARNAVEAHNGRLELICRPGQGALFRVLLPQG